MNKPTYWPKRAPKLHKHISVHLKQVFRSAHRHELETRLSHKPWTEEISKVTDWQLQSSDCALGMIAWVHISTALESTLNPYCTLCSLHEPMDRNHLGHWTALSNKTEYEWYWEARTKMMENWIFILLLFFPPFFCDYSLALGLYIYFDFFLFFLYFFFFF